MNKKEKKTRWWMVLLLVIAIAAPLGWYLKNRLEGQGPELILDNPVQILGRKANISGSFVDLDNGLASVRVTIMQGAVQQKVLLEEEFNRSGPLGKGVELNKSFSLDVDAKKLKLKDGKAILALRAVDYSLRNFGRGNVTYQEIPITFDTRPPSINVLTHQHNLNQGGSGVVVYQLSEPTATDGVRVGDDFYKGYGGQFSDPLVRVAFFALAYDQGKSTKIRVEAVDTAGNTGKAGFYNHINDRRFRKDDINLSDRFFLNILPQFDDQNPVSEDASLKDRFLWVNQKLRKANYNTVVDLTEESTDKILWKGPFLRLPKSASRARFADLRSYKYKGKTIDQQRHLGVDLAATAQSLVPAANAGRVAFADGLGIYGQTVLLDHGMGVFSMYSHLSRIDVEPQQHVSQGQPLGATGATGLAGGDHLHFSIMVGHTFVNPIEWWDPNWIKNNVTSKLNAVKALVGEEKP